MKIKLILLVSILMSYQIFAQNAITYSYDSAGNRIERAPVETNLAFKSQESENGVVGIGIIPTFVAKEEASAQRLEKEVLIANNDAIKKEDSCEEIKEDRSKAKHE